MTRFDDGVLSLSESQRLVRNTVRDICLDFDREYWRERERTETYPHEFVETLEASGLMGALVPEEYGGAGMGTPETVVMMEEIAASGGGFAAAQAVHGGICNSVPIVEYDVERYLREARLARLVPITQELALNYLGENVLGLPRSY